MPHQPSGHEHVAPLDRGLTLIELLISMTLTMIIGGVITAALITSMNAAESTARTAADSTDAQLIAAYLVRDAQAAGGTDPATAALDPTLGVSTTDDAGCTQAGTLVVRFAWTDRGSTPDADVVVTYAHRSDGQLVRLACTDAAPLEVVLAREVTEAALTCSPGGSCSGLPDSVTLSIAGGASGPPFTYTLTASLRADGQTAPDSINSSSVPLVVLRSGSCPALTLDGAAAVHVRGDAVIAGDCGVTPVTGDQTLLRVSGATTLPGAMSDPLSTMVPPTATCPSTGANPTIGSSTGPTGVTIYPSAVVVTSDTTFDAGRHVFCNGVTVTAGAVVRGSGVLWYVADGAVSIASSATLDLSPAADGPYQNLSLWTAGPQPVTISGGGTVHQLSGVIYAPHAPVSIVASAGVRLGGVVADRVTTAGTGPIRLGLPVPSLGSLLTVLPDGQLGVAYSASAPAVTSGTAPITYTATGLPTGLTISTSGTVSGTPTVFGTFDVDLLAVDATGASLPMTRTMDVSAAPVGCPLSTTGWWGEYWTNDSLSGAAAMCRADPALSFDWATGSPDPLIPADNFSARWTRVQEFAAGTYDFTTGSDDGVRLFIDGVQMLARWSARSTTYDTTRITLSGGTHLIVLEYYEAGGFATASVSWVETPSLDCPSAITGWRGEYFPNASLTDPSWTCSDDPAIDFDWATGKPAGVPASDSFSVRWTKTQQFLAGTYTFAAGGDDGVRLLVDGVPVIDDWVDTGYRIRPATSPLAAGPHTIVMEFYENGGFAQATLDWSVPVVPGAPTGVAAAAGDGTAAVTWSHGVTSGEPATASYTATATAGVTTRSCTSTAPATSCTLTGLVNGVTYSVSVSATNSIGTSPSSATVSLVPRPALLATTNVQLWLDAADASTLFADTAGITPATSGQQVARWNDKSAAANHLTQPNVAGRPTLGPQGLRAVPVFDGSSDILDRTTSTMPAGAAPSTTFSVSQMTAPASRGTIVAWGLNQLGQLRFFGSHDQARYITTNGAANPIGGDWISGSPGLLVGQYASQTGTLWADGAPPLGLAGTYSTAVSALSIGGNTASQFWNGTIDEVVVFDRTLTATERRTIEEYLARKWSVRITPSAPTAIATPGNNAVTVSWTPGWEGGSPITNTVVVASPGGASCSAPVPATACTVTGLTNGTAYTFAVTSTNAIGAGPAGATGPTAPGPPTTPTIAIGLGGTNSMLVYWQPPRMDARAPLTGAAVVVSAAGQTTRTCTAPAGEVACLVTGLTNDVAYTFTVTVSNAVGAAPPITNTASPTATMLDQMTAVPVAAFGLRRLDDSYSGPAVRIRRSSDDATADIGFVAGGQLDVDALMTFVGSGDGFITIHYDQSGNGRHAVQNVAARQPRLVVGGVLAQVNGRPAADASVNRGVLSNVGTGFTMGEVAAVLRSRTSTWVSYHDIANHDGPRNGTILEPSNSGVHGNQFPLALRKNGDGISPWASLAPITTPFMIDMDLIQASATRTRIGYGNWDTGNEGGTALQAESLVFATTIGAADRAVMNRNQSVHFGIALSSASGGPRTLDRVTAAPAAAYALRLLDGDYTGPAIRVRRSSDGAALDIGFRAGHLDTSALLAFVGAGDGYVAVWYDQSGNTRHLSQATEAYQPRIVAAGVVDTKNGRPTIRQATKVDGMGLQATWNFSGAAATANAVTSLDQVSGEAWKGLVSISTPGQPDFDSAARGIFFLQNHTSSQLTAFRAGLTGPSAAVTAGTQYIGTSTYDGTTSNLRANGVSAGSTASTGTFSTSLLSVGTRLHATAVASPEEWVGTYSEIVLFPTALGVSDRTTLEGEQGLYYGIQVGADTASTPVLDQLSATNAVAAFGLRKMRAAYTGPAVRVRRSSDNATLDIGFTASGQLDLQALIAFVGTGDGFVTIHYDQSGNGRNAVQTNVVQQPLVVRNGYVAALGTRPGVDMLVDRSVQSVAGTGFTMGEVAAVIQSPIDVFPAHHAIANHDGVWNGTILQAWGASFFAGPYPSSLRRNGVEVAPSAVLAPLTSPLLLDAELTNQGVTRTRIGFGNFGMDSIGGALFQADTVVFPSSLTDADRAILAANQAAYYGFTVPPAAPTRRTLDRMTTAPAAAYALRLLDADHVGPLVRVRRTSDNATLDIAADPITGHLDTPTLLTFVGSGSGYVVTWYDQSGNGRHLTQTTASMQPRIVSAGVLETKNGRPTIRQVAGVDGTGLTAGWSFSGAAVTTSAVASLDDTAGDPWKGLVTISAGQDDFSAVDRAPLLLQHQFESGIATFRNGALTGSAAVGTGVASVAIATYDGASAALRINGVASAATPSTGTFSTTQLAVGQRILAAPGNKYEWVGTYSEIVLFPSALGATDRTTLEGEQGLYYGIQTGADAMSTPVLDQVSAPPVAAYGLRRLRGAYTGSAVRVRRSSDNTSLDIGFTASGQLDLQALIAFVGTGDGFVTIHYDQSGNGRNAVQADPGRQPRIVRGGYIAAVGLRPGVNTLFDRGLLSAAGTGFTMGESTAVLVSPADIWIGHHGMVASDGDRNGTILERSGTTFHGNQYPSTLVRNGAEVPGGAPLAPLTSPLQLDVENVNRSTVRTRIGYGNYDTGLAGGSAIQAETIVFTRSLTDDERAVVASNQTTYFAIPLTAPPVVPRTLDRIATAPAAAYALRRLDQDYIGPAIRVRRSSDDAVLDIGFAASSGRLDVAALGAFVGTGDGFVVTWYDQSGNGRHLSQPAAAVQPRVVIAGVVQTANGRPVIRQTAAAGGGLQASWTFTGTAATAAVVASLDDAGGESWKGLVSIGNAGQNDFDGDSRGIFVLQHGGSSELAAHRSNVFSPAASVVAGTRYVAVSTFDGTSSILRTNGVSAGSTASIGTFSTTLLSVGTRLRDVPANAEEWVGTYSEVIVFGSALSLAETELLEREQGVANGIVVGANAPVLDGLATAPVGAYGLRRLDADHTGPAITVRRNSDNTTANIGFTADGQLDLAALMAFAGDGDAVVTVQYDQSGNGRHLVQTTDGRQPRIVRAGNVVMLNGRPAIDMSGDRALRSVTGAGFTMAEVTTVLVSVTPTWSAYHDVASHDGSRNGTILQVGGTGFHGNVYPATLRQNGGDLAAPALLAPITSPFVLDIGLTATTDTRTFVGYGNYDAGGSGGAAIQGDLIVMPTLLSPADRTTLERSLGAYYGIPVP